MDWKEALSMAFDGDDAPQFEPSTQQYDAADEAVAADKKLQTEPLRILTDRKARKGKTATIVEGFLCDDDELKEIAKELKTKVGVGGSSRCGEILLQGDCKAKTAEILKNKGYKVKII